MTVVWKTTIVHIVRISCFDNNCINNNVVMHVALNFNPLLDPFGIKIRNLVKILIEDGHHGLIFLRFIVLREQQK
jgi:hypothetical protein